MPWKPGQSGNPNGGRKVKPFRDALMMEIAAAERGEPSPAPKGSLRWNARQLLERGDPASIKEIADRLDGKVPQGVIGGEPDDEPIRITRVELVPAVAVAAGDSDAAEIGPGE